MTEYYEAFKILRENNYLPSMKFYYRTFLFKNIFGRNFITCQPFYKIFAAQYRSN